MPPHTQERQVNQDNVSTTGIEPGILTLREAANLLGTSTTTLRKLIRLGRLLEAEKVQTTGGRVWSIPAASIPSIAKREGFEINLNADALSPSVALSHTTEPVVDLSSLAEESYEPANVIEPDLDVALPAADPDDQSLTAELAPSDAGLAAAVATDLEPMVPKASVEIESAGEMPATPTLAEVVDAAFLETLLGAKASESEALVAAERHRVEYDSLAARQMELELRLSTTDDERRVLAERLHNETLARAIADARVTELRDQLQREIAYAEAERYERRQAVAREALAAMKAAETESVMGRRARRRLARRSPQE